MTRPLLTVTVRLHESGQSSGHADSTTLDAAPGASSATEGPRFEEEGMEYHNRGQGGLRWGACFRVLGARHYGWFLMFRSRVLRSAPRSRTNAERHPSTAAREPIIGDREK